MRNKKSKILGGMVQSKNIDETVSNIANRWKELTPAERADMDKRLEEAYPGGFNTRDEANALIAMAVRNGPIEDLHAGRYSAVVEDPSVSHITDAQIKAIMIQATLVLESLLRLRDENPELYRRWLQGYGMTYCQGWERGA